MNDLLDWAEPICHLPASGGQFAGRYLDISQIVRELVAEVKRQREEIHLLLRASTEYENNLAAKDGHIMRLMKSQETAAEVLARALSDQTMHSWEDRYELIHRPDTGIRSKQYYRDEAAELLEEAIKNEGLD